MLPFDSLYSKVSYLLVSMLPGLITSFKVKLKADVVVAGVNTLVAVIVFPFTTQEIDPVFEQEVYAKAGEVAELLHIKGNFISRLPELANGTFGSGVIVKV